MTDPRYGAIEAGGTKFVCLIGRGPDDVAASATFPTTDPTTTLAAAVAFFRDHARRLAAFPAAVGIASFGPVELRRNHPEYGHITRTPKPGWSGTDIAGFVGSELGVPVGFDTDVNGAALAEGRWGAAQNAASYAYMTIGTGVGVGIVVSDRVVHGLVHPEAGHVAVGRVSDDPFDGSCPYHGDCLEGMAAGPALAARFGKPATELNEPERARAAELVAAYVADGLRSLIYTVAPERFIIGGGVSELPGLMPRLRTSLLQSLGGYPGLPEHRAADFVVRPGLGTRSGALGGLVLAEQVADDG
jgi:fructokinase